MIIDRYTKAVFTLIAISLFLIALNPWIAPTKAYADLSLHDYNMLSGKLGDIASEINSIDCRR